MLHLSTLNTAASMATQLANQGHLLAAAPGSVLSALTQASSVPVDVQLNNLEQDLPAIINAISISTDSTSEAASQHDMALSSLADDVATAVTQHLHVAQNVVSPQVMSLGNRILQMLENVRPANPANAFQIKEYDLPSVIQGSAMAKEFSSYKSLRPKNNVAGMSFGPAPAAAEIRQKMIDSGFENAKDIAKWAACLSEDILLCVWKSFFESSSGKNPVSTANAFADADFWLGVFLLTHHFKDTVQDNGMSLASYGAALADIRDVAGVQLAMTIGQAESAEASGIVVLADDHLNHTISVFKPAYNKWLNEGGSVELLLGMSVGDRTITTARELTQYAEVLGRSWNTWIALKNTEARASYPTMARNLISSAFIESLNDVTDVEKEYYGESMVRRDLVTTQAMTYIQSLTTNDMDKPFEIAFRLVAALRFHFTAAAEILGTINTVLTESPKTDPEEAATIAALHYLGDYLADQIGVSR